MTTPHDLRTVTPHSVIEDVLVDARGLTSTMLADLIVARLEAAGFVVLDSCARCGEDPRAHWCADLEETFN